MTEPQRPDSDSASEQGKAAVPRTLELARYVWIAAALVGFARSVVQLADRQRLTSELRKLAPQMTQDQIDSAANSSVMVTLLFSLGLLVIYVGLSTRMVQGRNWARVVLAVFGAFGAVSTAITLLALAAVGRAELMRLVGVRIEPWDLLFSALLLVIEVAAVVLMFLPESNRFFRREGPQPPSPAGPDPFRR